MEKNKEKKHFIFPLILYYLKNKIIKLVLSVLFVEYEYVTMCSYGHQTIPTEMPKCIAYPYSLTVSTTPAVDIQFTPPIGNGLSALFLDK